MTSCTFLDDKSKKRTWLNRNYFFAATLLIVLLNILLYACGASSFRAIRPRWDQFSWANLFHALANSYLHANWQHCLLNMFCFLFAGIYLERKQGSLRFLLFLFILSLFTAFATSTNDISLGWAGFSGVNYGLYGYIIVEYLFMLLQKRRCDPFNVVAGAVVLGLIYLAMCFSGGTSKFTFAWYPFDLLHNLGHASGFFVGLVFGAYEMLVSLIQTSSVQTSA